MKNLLLAMFAIAVILTSCNKDNSISSASDQAISTSSLSTSVLKYIDSYYPDATITSAVAVNNSKAATIVTLSTSEQLAFNDLGGFLGDGTNLHSGTDMSGDHHGRGGHGMGPGHDGDTTGGPCGMKGPKPLNAVAIDSLPTAIKTYISTNYPALTAMHADIDTTCQYGAVYEVMAGAVGTEPVKLAFSKESVYLYKGQRFRTADMPQAVKDAIAKFDTNSRIRGEQLTLADGTIQYSAFVNVSGVKKRIVLAVDGTVVCQ